MTFFHELGEVFFQKTSLFDTTITNGLLKDLQPIATAILAIFLIWRVVEIMLGSAKKPISDVVIEVMVWAIIWGFVFNSTYLNMVTNGMNEVYTWAGGGISFFDNLDVWWEKLYKIADNLYAKDKSYIFPGRGIFALIVVSIGTIIITFLPFMVIIISSLFMQILIMIAPFMILTLLFPTIKKTFNNFVELFLRVILTILLISIIQKSMISKIDGMLSDFLTLSTNAAPGIIVSTGAIIFLTCLLYAFILSLSVPIAKTLAGSTNSIGWLGKRA